MLKDLFIFFVVICCATACSSVKPIASTAAASPPDNTSVSFIEDISVTPGSGGDGKGSLSRDKDRAVEKKTNKPSSRASAIEYYSPLKFKYAILMNVPVEQVNNEKLLDFLEQWCGTPYHYGGASKDGIDCSAFASLLMSAVYGIGNLPRIARDQYFGSKRIKEDDLQEGDLVFFHTMGKKKTVTHVGVYLCNNKFVHASVSGVMISDMEDGYYAHHYVGAGRVRESY